MTDSNQQGAEELRTLGSILSKYGYTAQADFVEELLHLYENNSPEFAMKLASIEMWGGSGAVWDAYIPQGTPDQARSLRALIALADYMNAQMIGPKLMRERAESLASTFRQWLIEGL